MVLVLNGVKASRWPFRQKNEREFGKIPFIVALTTVGEDRVFVRRLVRNEWFHGGVLWLAGWPNARER